VPLSSFDRLRIKTLRQVSPLPSIVLIFLVGVMLSLPLFVAGFPRSSADGIYHATCYSNFAEQLWSGEVYPRWMYKMNAGLGSPTFYYYPPFAFYFTSVLKPLFPKERYGWHQLGISAAIALIASGIFMYFWLKRITGGRTALLGAVIYLIVPYHVAEDLYGRGAFAEVWAFVWMPLILCLVHEVHRKARFCSLALAASVAFLLLTHLLTAMIFLPLAGAYACFLGYSGRSYRVTLVTAGAICLGFGLSSLYWIPALFARTSVFFDEFRTGYFYYGNWLLGKQLHLGGSLRYFWMVFEVAILLGSAFLVLKSRLKRTQKPAFWFWGTIILCSAFMMTSASKFVWEAIPPLQMLQFPWRFNAILAVAICPVFALFVSTLKKKFRFSDLGIVAVVAFILLVWIYGLGKKECGSFETSAKPSLDEARSAMLVIAADVNPMRPKSVASLAPAELIKIVEKVGQVPPQLARKALIGEVGTTFLHWKPRDIAFEIDASADAVVTIPQFYYPGWTAYLDGSPRTLAIKPSAEGLIRIDSPAGRHRVQLRLDKSKEEKAGELLSLTSLLLTAMTALSSHCRALRRKNSQS